MKLFVVFAVCLSAASAASYGSYEAPMVRVSTPSYSAPAPMLKSYDSYETKSYAAPIVKKAIIPIVRLALDDDNYGTFRLDAVSGDGTHINEEGHLKNLGDPEGPVSVMSGSYSFVGDDGKTYTVHWTADENGFRATGDHLPTPPPIPAEIQESLRMATKESSYGSSYSAPLVRTESYQAPAVRMATY